MRGSAQLVAVKVSSQTINRNSGRIAYSRIRHIPHPQAVRLSHTLRYNNHVTPNDTPDRQPTCSVLFPKGRRAKVHMLRTAVGRERARQVQLRRGRPHHGPSRHWRGVAAAAAAGLVGE